MIFRYCKAATVYIHCIHRPMDDRTAAPREGNVRTGYVVVTPVCIFLEIEAFRITRSMAATHQLVVLFVGGAR